MTNLGSVLDTIGLELETCNTDPRPLAESMSKYGLDHYFRRDRDASSEMFLKRLTSRLIFIDPHGAFDNARVQTVTTGIELISNPMSWEVCSKVVPILTGELIKLGELERSTRGAIHVHVGFPTNFGSLKNALLFSLKFESLFYQLGTMGYQFRGSTNRGIYCRPHSTYGPPAVTCEDGRARQILNVDDLLECGNADDFWRLYGVNSREPKRYHPSRYFGVNLLSTLIHGTLEFRHFNVSLNSRMLLSIMRLCQSSTEMIMKVPSRRLVELPDSTVFSINDDERLLEILFSMTDEFSEAYPMQEIQKNELRALVRSAPKVIFERGFTKTHLWEKFNLGEYFYGFGNRESLPKERLLDSGFIDSHNGQVKQIEFTTIANR